MKVRSTITNRQALLSKASCLTASTQVQPHDIILKLEGLFIIILSFTPSMRNFPWLMCVFGLQAVTSLKLNKASDYEVRRGLLEEKYPAFQSFRGLMHAGMMPAGIIDNDMGHDEEFSSYFFWLLRPDKDATSEQSSTTFRNDTLLIWLNGGPGVRLMTQFPLCIFY
jgi:hypothetical protein